MAILYRTVSELSVDGMEARLTVYSGTNRIRAELEPYAASGTSCTGNLDVTVTYGEESVRLTASPFTKAVSAAFVFVPDTRALTLTAETVTYGGESGTSHVFRWCGDGSLPAPSPEFTYYTGFMRNRLCRTEWTYGDIPEGYAARTLGVWIFFAEENGASPVYVRSCVIGEKSDILAYEHTEEDAEVGNVLFYRTAIGLFPEDEADTAGREEYAAYAEADSPAYVCSGSNIYTLAPCNFRYGAIRRNRTFFLEWDTLPAASETEGFRIYYQYDGGNWYSLYTGKLTENRYPCTITKDISTVIFKLSAYSTRSEQEKSEFIFGPLRELGRSNVYVGHGGGIIPAAEITVGGRSADASLVIG